MNDAQSQARFPAKVQDEAAAWVLRRDRGLTAAEQDEFSQWLAADADHGACLAAMRRNWDRLDQLANWRPQHAARPNRDLLAPPPRRWTSVVVPLVAMAAAAAVAVVFWLARAPDHPATVTSLPLDRVVRQTLDDGSLVDLNRGARIAVAFAPGERRVRLISGEAHFAVAKNPDRPFVVSAGGVDVRAVGTAFNVRLDATAVEVLVTEGRVRVRPPARADTAPAANGNEPMVEAGERAVVALVPAGPAPKVAAVSSEEVEHLLAWKPRLLDFTAAPLADIVAEFNARNRVRLIVDDPELGATRVSASLQSDNVEGFVRLLEAGFNVRAERIGDVIVLRRRQ